MPKLVMMTLSEAQRDFLQFVAEGEVDTTWSHPDAEALAARGLVTIRRCVPGSAFVGGTVVKITDAGRSALEQG